MYFHLRVDGVVTDFPSTAVRYLSKYLGTLRFRAHA